MFERTLAHAGRPLQRRLKAGEALTELRRISLASQGCLDSGSVVSCVCGDWVESEMTAKEFRRVALALPKAEEREHMGHPDFRVGGKIFATLGYPDQSWAMVKLKPADQARFYEAEPDVFVPFNGAWGRQGATKVILKAAKKAIVNRALAAAWQNVAPKALAKRSQAGARGKLRLQ